MYFVKYYTWSYGMYSFASCFLLNVTFYFKLFLCRLNSDRQKGFLVSVSLSFFLCEVVHIDLSSSVVPSFDFKLRKRPYPEIK